MSDFFKRKVVAKPTFAEFSEGEHLVRVSRVESLDSFHSYDGSNKEDLPEWDNATPQLAVTFVSAEDGKAGAITNRFNGCGYARFEDFTEKEIKKGKIFDVNGYACQTQMIDGEEKTVRLEDEERTEACDNILNQFANAIGMEEGDNLMDSLEAAISAQDKLIITVASEMYDGKEQKKVSRFKKPAEVTENEFSE